MSEETFDQDEARRLISAALGGLDSEEFSELVERAENSSAVFLEAAEAYRADNLLECAAVIERYLDSSASADRATFDLCASGATKVAALFADVPTHEAHGECTGEVRLDADSAPNIIIRTAIQCVNAAADNNPEVVGELLVIVHGFAGTEGLGMLATSLVDTYTEVSRMVAELQ